MYGPNVKLRLRRWGAGSGIILSFVVAAEIIIMISPFAFFFYAVFNPFLLTLNQSDATRWLTAFFLPHMLVPPTGLLVVLRILGSVLFVAGLLIFLVCAGQVYIGKLLKKGTATTGLYVVVRHPQYVGLSLAALGLAIMWPRFLTLVLFVVMLFLYYVLARDEERRMIGRFGQGYVDYMNRTGMFVPRGVERLFVRNAGLPQGHGTGKVAVLFLLILAVVIGGGFLLRDYTVHHLPLERIGDVDVVTIAPGELSSAKKLVPIVLKDSLVASELGAVAHKTGHHILAYFVPIDYLMQGMIANTGKRWKLFERHKTFGMITDYIFHPFAHLMGKHTHEFINLHNKIYEHPMMKRRIIFIEILSNGGGLTSPYDDFGINDLRRPLFFVDVDLRTSRVLQVRNTPAGSGWGTVPTPTF